MSTPEERLTELGLELPPTAAPKGVYRAVVVSGSMALTSGHLPVRGDGSLVTGHVGGDLSIEEGYAAARLAALGILASVNAELGSLGRIRQLVKLLGFVNCPAEFTQHPAVINGASELFRDVLGEEIGIGARSALGAGSLPLDVAVEIEAIFEIV